MYGKLFASMYDGTLGEHWEALVTFQQMIILCDQDGVIDVTHEALHRRTGIPIDIITAGIDALEQPDERSRTPDCDGRRIIRIDEHRDWGWQIVNHEKYKKLVDSDTKRHQTRERVRQHRARLAGNKCNTVKRTVTHGNARKRHTDTDTDTDAKNSVASATCSLFDEFWRHCPKKVGKQAAKKAFAKACKIQTARHIIDRMAEFAKSDKARGEFCPHPATWLNEGRYDDDPECWRVETLEQRNKRFAAEWLERNPG